MTGSSLKLRVIYEDLPDLIELALQVNDSTANNGPWVVGGYFYEVPQSLVEQASKLLNWVNQPQGAFSLVSLHNSGLAKCSIQFYTIDRAGHTRCCVQYREDQSKRVEPCDPTRQVTLELRTEIGAIERFAKECLHLTHKGAEAELICESC
jgi:hypothetical protein